MDDAAFNWFMVQVCDGVSHASRAGRYATVIRVFVEIAGDDGPTLCDEVLAALRRGSPTSAVVAVLLARQEAARG